MKRSAIRELTFRLIYSLEIQKEENLEEQIELYIECNEIADKEAQEYLKDIMKSSMYMTNSIAKIQKAVAEYYDVTVESLKSKKRTANINNARQIAMYICKMNTEETIEKIGLEFNRDHATVIHACDKIDEEYKNNEELRKEIKDIKDKIGN